MPEYARTGLLLGAGLRLLLLVSLPAEALFQYGDFQHYYNVATWSWPGHCPTGAGACWPLLDFWHEFPPLFPYLAVGLLKLLGRETLPSFHSFAYSLALVLLAADVGSMVLVRRIARRLYAVQAADWITLVYALLPAPLILSWWTFDGLTTFWMLLGLWALLERRDALSVAAIGLGALTKLVPVLLLPAVWRARPAGRAGAITAGVVGVVGLGLAPFLFRAPTMALASLQAQASKSSYATLWAMLDGNLQRADGQPITGNFGGLGDRLDPTLATVPVNNPSRIPGLLTLCVAAAGLGLVWARAGRTGHAWTDRQTVQLLALTWTVFVLWSKGWSPQWQQMLAPLILLTLPNRTGLLFALALAAVSFLEWPVLLSRGFAWGYWLTIPLRTAMIVGWAVYLTRALLPARTPQPVRVPA